MNILITGQSGTGKTILANKIKNYIFKVDANSKIFINDANEPVKEIGKGTNEYYINIMQIAKEEELTEADIVVEIKNQVLVNRIKEL